MRRGRGAAQGAAAAAAACSGAESASANERTPQTGAPGSAGGSTPQPAWPCTSPQSSPGTAGWARSAGSARSPWCPAHGRATIRAVQRKTARRKGTTRGCRTRELTHAQAPRRAGVPCAAAQAARQRAHQVELDVVQVFALAQVVVVCGGQQAAAVAAQQALHVAVLHVGAHRLPAPRHFQRLARQRSARGVKQDLRLASRAAAHAKAGAHHGARQRPAAAPRRGRTGGAATRSSSGRAQCRQGALCRPMGHCGSTTAALLPMAEPRSRLVLLGCAAQLLLFEAAVDLHS